MLRLLAPCLLAAAACAAPAPAGVGRLARLPASSGGPAVRFVQSIPDAGAGAPAQSWWRRAGRAVLGLEGGGAVEPLFTRPFGLAAVGELLLVADPDAGRVTRIDWKKGTAEALACGSRAWESPMAVAVGGGGVLFVADGGGWLARLSPAGDCTTFGEGRLERPTGIAVQGDTVWVADPPRHRLVAFSLGGEETSAAEGGERGLQFPTSVASAPDGTLLVVDALRFRVVRLDPGGREIGSLGDRGEGEALLVNPKCVLAAGATVWVSDVGADQVKGYDASGAFQVAVGGSGPAAGQLLAPAGLAVSAGYLFVADSLNRRVAVYQLAGEA